MAAGCFHGWWPCRRQLDILIVCFESKLHQLGAFQSACAYVLCAGAIVSGAAGVAAGSFLLALCSRKFSCFGCFFILYPLVLLHLNLPCLAHGRCC